MKLKAISVEPDCDWITEGRIYSATPCLSAIVGEGVVIVTDDRGLKIIVFIDEAKYLNEYIEWEIIN